MRDDRGLTNRHQEIYLFLDGNIIHRFGE
jgi:hypothetical protein